MRNLYILFCATALLLALVTCTKKESIISDPYPNIDSLYLDCIEKEPFVIRAEYNDQTNIISFEYYDNSANPSTVLPTSIDWVIDDGFIQSSQSGESSGTSFAFNTNFNVGVSIAFDDNTTFQDQFCVNINQFIPSVFNVCSNHQYTVGCQERNRSDKRALVIVDMF